MKTPEQKHDDFSSFVKAFTRQSSESLRDYARKVAPLQEFLNEQEEKETAQ
jgi:hypothetical protein